VGYSGLVAGTVEIHIGSMAKGATRALRASTASASVHIRMLRIHSTSIAAAGYDPDAQMLRVRFIGGGTYDYLDVPADVFRRLLDAPSKGRFVNWHVKPRYRCKRLIGRA
jgi:hypothetical protein